MTVRLQAHLFRQPWEFTVGVASLCSAGQSSWWAAAAHQCAGDILGFWKNTVKMHILPCFKRVNASKDTFLLVGLKECLTFSCHFSKKGTVVFHEIQSVICVVYCYSWASDMYLGTCHMEKGNTSWYSILVVEKCCFLCMAPATQRIDRGAWKDVFSFLPGIAQIT